MNLLNRRQFLVAAGATAAAMIAFKGVPGFSETAQPAMGLGMNLAHVVDWSTEWAFVDLFKQSRPWMVQDSRHAQVDVPDSIKFTDNGDPLPAPGQKLYTMMCCNIEGHYPGGRYVCEFDGQGKLKFGGDAIHPRVIDSNSYEMDVMPSKGGMQVSLLQTNPDDPVRNIRIWMPGFEHADSPFHPLFLERLQPFKGIRFMDWQQTNNSPLSKWSQRTRPNSPRQQSPNGVALEYMIELCNTLDTDAWFCMPHLADEDFIRQFALLVKENLKPERKIYVEWSNEVWNRQFGQAKWVYKQAAARNVPPPHVSADCALKAWNIWHEVFGNDKQRIVRVASGQEGGTHVIQQMTDRLAGEFDAVSCAAYFCPPPKDISRFDTNTTAEQVLQCSIGYIQKTLLPSVAMHKAVADQWSARLGRKIPLVLYEGGQGITAYGGVGSHDKFISWQQAAFDCQGHPMMRDAYQLLLNGLNSTGVEKMFAYSYASKRSRSGSWGHLQFQDDPMEKAPKYAALVEWQKERGTASKLAG